MRIAIRTDASVNMGIGHVMRCLTLAEALRNNNIDITFISREHDGNLFKFIEDKGFKLKKLKKYTKKFTVNNVYDEWLGLPWEIDAEETKTFLCEGESWDWLIVDHYALNDNWEKVQRGCTKRILVIDDLADRKHDCDVLIDQTFGRIKEDYKKLVSKETDLLLGANYALLRNEFYNLRSDALKRRSDFSEVHRILVSLGGTDPDNVTEIILKGLNESQLDNNVEIDVLLGSNSPHQGSVRKYMNKMSLHASLSIDADDMAQRMLNADLAIGAGGSTAWERCCLGLPSLVTINAGNQNNIVNELHSHGVIINLGEYKQLTSETIARQVNDIYKDIDKLMLMSNKALKIVDGCGASRVAHVLQAE